MDHPLLAAVGVGLLVAATCLLARPAARAVAGLLGRVAAAQQSALEAERRAEQLLRDVLTPAEHGRMLARGYLDVASPGHPGRIYRVPRDGGIVVMYEGSRPVAGLCVQPVDALPTADTVAMHKLMIEGAEVEYLRRANHLSVATLSRYGLGALYTPSPRGPGE